MYQDLEDYGSSDEHQHQTQAIGIQSHYLKGPFKFGGNDVDFYEEEDELPENARLLAIHQIRTSDTRVFDGSSTSFGTIQSISATNRSTQGSAAGSSAGCVRGSLTELYIQPGGSRKPSAVPQFQEKGRPFQKFKKQRIDGRGFIPVMPNKVDHTPAGFRFQKHRANESPASKYIIDVKDQKKTRNYKSKAKRTQPPSGNPHDAEYDPLNFVLGHAKGILASTEPTNLTTKNLYQLDRSHAMIGSGISSVPSVVAVSADTPYPANESQAASLFQSESVGTDSIPREPLADFNETIRKNFVSEDEVIKHKIRRTQFERQNAEWSNSAALREGFNLSSVYVNHFADDNVVKTEVATEIRLLDWDQYGNYKGEHQGSVKKRIRLWVVEQYKWWDAEMKAASDAYKELMEMRPSERMKAINAARMPITHWAGGSRAAARDIFEADYLPAIYTKKWDPQKERCGRLKRIAKAAAKAEYQKSSRSRASQHTSNTVSVHGKLGDMDGPMKPTPATEHGTHGVGKTRNSMAYVYSLAERAIRAKYVRQTRIPDSKHSAEANRDSYRDGCGPSSSSCSIIMQSRDERIAVGSFLDSSEYSVAGAHSLSSRTDSPSFGSRPPYAHNRGARSKQRSKFGSDTSSSATNRGKNDTESPITNITGAELLGFDDSPLFQDLSDVSFPLDGLNTFQVEQMKLAEKQSSTRGRVVVVRLHAAVEFSGEAIAKRLFGGIVQEFQLHPEQKMAVVVFIHPIEARAFLRHLMQVRTNGSQQDIREQQIEAAYYNGREQESIQPYQKHIMSYHVGAAASRTLKIHNIPSTRSYKDVAADLSNRLGKLILYVQFESPKGHFTLTTEGRSAIVEFASLSDAIEAYLSLNSGMETGYENCQCEFTRERSEKPAYDKPYCDCLGCHERREKHKAKRIAKIQELRAQRDYHLSSRSSVARTEFESATPQPSSVISSSGYLDNGSATQVPISDRASSPFTASSVLAYVQGEIIDTETENLIEFESGVNDDDEDWD